MVFLSPEHSMKREQRFPDYSRLREYVALLYLIPAGGVGRVGELITRKPFNSIEYGERSADSNE